MTELFLRRTTEGPNSTAGKLIDGENTLAHTIEQEWNGNQRRESRIPAGRYQLKLKKFSTSRFDETYRKQFGNWHKGMIEIAGVPDRAEILFHMGNFHHNTQGCVLLGTETELKGKDWQIPPGLSRAGYRAAYPVLLEAAQSGDGWLVVSDPVEEPAPLIA